MMNKFKKIISLLIVIGLVEANVLAAKKSFGYKKSSYTKKAPMEGLGKISKTTKFPKTKIVSAHYKVTKKGGTFVNAYAKSK